MQTDESPVNRVKKKASYKEYTQSRDRIDLSPEGSFRMPLHPTQRKRGGSMHYAENEVKIGEVASAKELSPTERPIPEYEFKIKK